MFTGAAYLFYFIVNRPNRHRKLVERPNSKLLIPDISNSTLLNTPHIYRRETGIKSWARTKIYFLIIHIVFKNGL
jgi:hypothetical protein